MTKRLLLFAIFLVASLSTALAQIPPPCPANNTPPADVCGAACIYCNFNGLTGSSAGYNPHTVTGWCGSIENEQWLGFIASCGSVTFIVTPSNCANNNGLQAGVFTDCSSAPIGCNGGAAGGGNTPVSVTVGTTPGQNYFLCIDGWAGDQCDFNITVVPPQCAGAPTLLPTLPIAGPNSICPGGTGVFTVPAVTGASYYIWDGPPGSTINGSPPPVTLQAPAGNRVTITFPSTPTAGVFPICVQPVNSCNTGTQMCRNVQIQMIPPTIFPNITICSDDIPYTLPWGAEVTSTGLYTTTLTTALGCDSTLRQFVLVRPPINTFLPPQVLCQGGSLTVCGQEYNQPGTYNQVCTSADGCDSTVNFTIIMPPVNASITANGTLSCTQSSVTLTAAPTPGTLSWSNGASTPSITVASPGTYTLTVTQQFGQNICSDTASYTVTGSNAVPNVSIAPPAQLSCTNSSVTLTASSTTPGVTYSWGSPPQLSVNTPGTYTVTVTNPTNNCTATSSVTVSGNNTPPTATLTATTITCINPTSTITATSNAATATYAWSAGATGTGSTATTSAPGNYTVTVTNTTNGCTSTAGVTVAALTNNPDASASGNTLTCTNSSVSLTASSGTPGVTYAWSNSTTGPTTTVSTPGTYTVVVTNPANGCTATATATAQANTTPPGATASGANLSCAVTQVSLTGGSPTSGVTYSWTGPNGFTSTQQNPAVNTPGTYVLTTLSALNGCTSSASATVGSNTTSPSVSASGGTISCTSSSTNLTASSPVTGGTFTWFGSGNVQVGTGSTYAATTPGTYTVVVTDPSNGCTGTATAQAATDSNVPNVSVNNAEITCLNASVTLTGSSTTPGVTTAWTGYSGNPIIVNTPGNYTFTVTAPNGCTAVGTAVVADDTAPPNVSATGGTLSCLASNLQIVGNSTTPGVTWSWSAPGYAGSTMQNPTVTDPNTYTLVVTNPSNGCTASATAIVNADTNAPTASSTTGTLTCTSTSVTLNGSATGPSPISTYVWTGPGIATTASGQNYTASQPGVFTLTVTSQNGCTDAVSVTVGSNTTPPQASANTSGVIGCTVTSVDLSATTNATAATYSWSGGLGSSSTVTTSTPGNYTVTVTNTANGCTSTSSVTVASIVENPILSIATVPQLTCTNTSSTINLTATFASQGLQVDTYAWSNNNSTEDINVTTPGIYTVTVTANNGCTSTATASVSQNITQPNVSTQNGTLSCSATSLNLTGTSTTPGVTWLWSGPSITPANATQQNPTISAAGNYVLVVTNPANGCTNSATAIISPDNNAPTGTITASATLLTCAVTSANLTISSPTATQYVWGLQGGSPISGATSTTLTVTNPGTYQVTITAPNGCTAVVPQLIDQNIVAPTATTTNDTLDCITGAGVLTVTTSTPNPAYLWSGPGGVTGTASSLPVTNPGNYTVVVTNQVNGCSATFGAQVIPNQNAPNVSATGAGTLTCTVLSLPLTGSSTTPGVTGSWTLPNGSTNPASNITATVPGDYLYTVTAPNGCLASATVAVAQNITPPANLAATGQTLTCTNPTLPVSVSTSTSPVTYVWSGPNGFTSTQQSPGVSVPGTYTVTVTGVANGCAATASTTVVSNQNNPNLSVSTNFPTLTCTNPVATLNGQSTTPGVTWQWNGPGLNSTLEDPTTNQAGTYTVVITAPNGCTTSGTISIAVDQNPPANPNATVSALITCQQPTVTLTGSSSTPGVTYSWTFNGIAIPGNQTATVGQTGIYTLIVTGPNGCTSTSTVQVSDDGSIPNVSLTGQLLTCILTSFNPTISCTNCPSNMTWLWTGPGGFTSTQREPTITVPGNYVLVATNPTNGCTRQVSLLVNQNIVTPSVSIANPPLLDCNTDQVPLIATVSGNSTYTYAWSTADGSIVSGGNTSTAIAGLAGIYNLVVTDTQNGCTSQDSESVEVDGNIPQAAAAQVNDVKCFGDTNGSILMGNITGGAAPYLFSLNGQPFTTAGTFTFLPPGQHEVTIQDANGCEITATYTINEPEELSIYIGNDTTIRLGEYIDVNLDNLAQYVSDPTRADTFTYTPLNFEAIFCDTCLVKYSTRYTITVIDSNGCTATDDRLIKVDRTRSVIIPNVFKPGSGRGNDIFTLFGGIDVELVKSFRIYDRWGEEVFSRFNFEIDDNFQNGWDGKFRGKDAAPAVYLYVIDVLFKDGESELYKGDCAIVR